MRRLDVWHWNGWTWTQYPDVSPEFILSVAAASDTDVWVAADNGYAAHFDGTTWTPHPVPTTRGIEIVRSGAFVFAHDDTALWQFSATRTL